MIIGDISVLHIVSLLLNIGLEQDYVPGHAIAVAWDHQKVKYAQNEENGLSDVAAYVNGVIWPGRHTRRCQGKWCLVHCFWCPLVLTTNSDACCNAPLWHRWNMVQCFCTLMEYFIPMLSINLWRAKNPQWLKGTGKWCTRVTAWCYWSGVPLRQEVWSNKMQPETNMV